MNIEIFILIDWISCLFIRVVLLISSIIIFYRIIYIERDYFKDRFIKLVILFILSIILIIISPNLIRILFGWDGLGLVSYCLVIYYQNFSSFNSGIVTVLCNRIGDIGLLISIGLSIRNGRWNMFLLEKNIIIIFIILIAAITKRAQIPFSVWLPIAIAAPTPVSALVHSSTLVTAGVYLIIRFNKFIINCMIDKILFYISIFTMLISGIMANFENDLKKIIALSTLRQLGLIIIILRLGFKILAFYHLLTHAIFKSLLFMCAGVIIHLINNNQDIRLCGNLNEFIPFIIIRFYISRLALIGFPFLSGFYSKDIIIEIIYIIKINLIILIFILLRLIITVSYSLRLMYYMYFRNIKNRFFFYKENKFINISIIILLLFRMIYGAILNWIFFFDNDFRFIKINLKLLTLIMLIFGVIFGLLIYLKNLIKLYKIRYFFRSIWFINYIYFYLYKPYLNFGNINFIIDKSWVEFLSKLIFLNIFINIKLIFNNYKIYIFRLIFLFNLFWLFLIL